MTNQINPCFGKSQFRAFPPEPVKAQTSPWCFSFAAAQSIRKWTGEEFKCLPCPLPHCIPISSQFHSLPFSSQEWSWLVEAADSLGKGRLSSEAFKHASHPLTSLAGRPASSCCQGKGKIRKEGMFKCPPPQSPRISFPRCPKVHAEINRRQFKLPASQINFL